ncbi:hypothetical protein F5Y11DRAFT_348909 [Daldinia sp. FL1419]|nr:hypothetical protein F5Y11DRAFT_348909 [Daldinia sp. FL1419]
MNILDLPPEVLHIILVYAALNWRIKRALRLRLVCKVLAAMTHSALFETRLMDRHMSLGCLNEEDPTIGRFVEMRRIAQAISQETELDWQDVVKILCSLALHHREYSERDKDFITKSTA